MRHEVWRAILGARGDLDRLVASTVGDYPNQGPPRAVTVRQPPQAPGGPQLVRGASRATTTTTTTATATAPVTVTAPVAAAEYETLHRLHLDVLQRIEPLRNVLAAEPGGEQAMLVLVLYFDERIMRQLPEFLATSWPLLQIPFINSRNGGSYFFRLIDQLMEELQPQLVFEVLYFCLGNGFQGQYADDLPSIERYKQDLRARIAAPEPQRPPRELASAASPAPIKLPVLYYVVAVVVVLVMASLLTVWSNQ